MHFNLVFVIPNVEHKVAKVLIFMVVLNMVDNV